MSLRPYQAHLLNSDILNAIELLNGKYNNNGVNLDISSDVTINVPGAVFKNIKYSSRDFNFSDLKINSTLKHTRFESIYGIMLYSEPQRKHGATYCEIEYTDEDNKQVKLSFFKTYTPKNKTHKQQN